MHPNLTTAFLTLVPACLLTAGLLWSLWRTMDRAPFIGCWALASGLAATAFLLFGIREALPALLVITVGNVALHLANMFLWAGARRLRGAHAPLWLLSVPALVWLAACTLPGFVEAPRLRLGLASILLIMEGLAFAFELWRSRRVGKATHLILTMVGLALLHVLIQLFQLTGLMLFTSTTMITLLAIMVDGPIFMAIGFLAFALANASMTERDTLLLAAAQMRESELKTETIEREAAALRAGRAEIERLHAGLPALIFLRESDADGRSSLIYRSGNVEAVTGISANVVKGLDNIATFAEHPAMVTQSFRSALQHGEATLEWRIIRPDGEATWLRSTWHVQQRLPGGKAILVGYTVNITAERAANARAAVSGRLASLGEMATGLAHELKQPLQSIMLTAEIAQGAARDIAAHDIAERLELVINQTFRAGKIIDNLRRFANGDAGGAPVKPVQLTTAIANVLALVSGSLHDAGISVETRLPQDMPSVLAHPVALEQVLMNLLFNARDALASDMAKGRQHITISAEMAGGLVSLSVADTGGGIAPEVAEHVFEPFVTTKGPDRGTGLGLSISHGLITAMGGSITARNGPEGAIFVINLRIAGRDQGNG